MSRLFAAASSEHLTVDSAPVTAVPLTMACWFYPTTQVALKTLVWVGDKDVADHWFNIHIDNGNTDGICSARVSSSSGVASASTTATYTLNAWNHLAGVFTSNTSRDVYLNGVAGTTNTTSRTPMNADRVSVGRFGDSTPSGYMNGRLCEAAIWSSALSASDIGQLYAAGVGKQAGLVSAGTLVWWAALEGIDSPEPDHTVGARHLTATGTTIAAHAPVYWSDIGAYEAVVETVPSPSVRLSLLGVG